MNDHLNLPIVHRSKEVSTMPEGFFIFNGNDQMFVAGNIIARKSGQIEIVLAHSLDMIDFMTKFYIKDNWTIDITESFHFHMFFENFAFGTKRTAYFGGNVPISDPRVYIVGENAFQNNDPAAFRVKSPGAGFLKKK